MGTHFLMLPQGRGAIGMKFLCYTIISCKILSSLTLIFHEKLKKVLAKPI